MKFRFRFNIITLVGLLLIVLGTLAFAIGMGRYAPEDPPPAVGVEAPAEPESLPLAPLLGGIALVSGIVFVVLGARGPPKRRS